MELSIKSCSSGGHYEIATGGYRRKTGFEVGNGSGRRREAITIAVMRQLYQRCSNRTIEEHHEEGVEPPRIHDQTLEGMHAAKSGEEHDSGKRLTLPAKFEGVGCLGLKKRLRRSVESQRLIYQSHIRLLSL